MKIKVCTLFVLLATGTFAPAQNVGYMGKKLNIVVEGAFSPALDNPVKPYLLQEDYVPVSINKRIQIGAEWVVSRTRFIGVQVGIIPSGLMGSVLVHDTDFSGGFPVITETFVTGGARLNAFPISIYTGHSRRNKDYIMPLGHYRTHSLLVIPYTVRDTKGFWGNKGQKLASGVSAAYMFGLGKQMIFMDQLTFRYGVQFGLVLSGSWQGKLSSYTKTFHSLSKFEINEMANNRLQGAMLFNLNVGLGYLL